MASPGFKFPRVISSAVWTEDRLDPTERFGRVCARLREEGNVVKLGSEYGRWDVEVFGGMFGSARLLMATEDHGAGAQYVRTRISPRARAGARSVLIFFGVLTGIAIVAREAFVGSVLGAFWLSLALRTLQQEGQATAALLRATSPAPPPQNAKSSAR
jgi:hypothetical protein